MLSPPLVTHAAHSCFARSFPQPLLSFRCVPLVIYPITRSNSPFALQGLVPSEQRQNALVVPFATMVIPQERDSVSKSSLVRVHCFALVRNQADILCVCVSDQAVVPGNIIVRQRGTQFHPGQHVRCSSILLFSFTQETNITLGCCSLCRLEWAATTPFTHSSPASSASTPKNG
jgi:hypothetical protein